jgi:hypothetical protein
LFQLSSIWFLNSLTAMDVNLRLENPSVDRQGRRSTFHFSSTKNHQMSPLHLTYWRQNAIEWKWGLATARCSDYEKWPGTAWSCKRAPSVVGLKAGVGETFLNLIKLHKFNHRLSYHCRVSLGMTNRERRKQLHYEDNEMLTLSLEKNLRSWNWCVRLATAATTISLKPAD